MVVFCGPVTPSGNSKTPARDQPKVLYATTPCVGPPSDLALRDAIALSNSSLPGKIEHASLRDVPYLISEHLGNNCEHQHKRHQ